MVLGTVILLMTGLMVSFFIGDSIIISGFKREKKLADKTESEVAMESNRIDDIEHELEEIKDELDDIQKHTHKSRGIL